MVTVNIGHEFGGPGLCRVCPARVGGEAQMAGERRLDAVTVEDFALDGGAIDNLLRDQFYGQAITRIGVKMVQCANDDARTSQESFF
jgi:hypothetical protein